MYILRSISISVQYFVFYCYSFIIDGIALYFFRRAIGAALIDMIIQVAKSQPSEVSINALFLVPLWHLLTRSNNTPFSMQEFRDYNHNSYSGVWWGQTDSRLKEISKSLKIKFHNKDMYNLLIFYIVRTVHL